MLTTKQNPPLLLDIFQINSKNTLFTLIYIVYRQGTKISTVWYNEIQESYIPAIPNFISRPSRYELRKRKWRFLLLHCPQTANLVKSQFVNASSTRMARRRYHDGGGAGPVTNGLTDNATLRQLSCLHI